MADNPLTRGTCPGRARPPHRASFKRGHARRGGRQKGTANVISSRVRKVVAAAAKRIPRAIKFTHRYWQRIIDTNPLIIEAAQNQGTFTFAGTPRFRSRNFNMKRFCQDLSAVAMRAIKTGQFVDRDLVDCLTLLGIRDRIAFARFSSLAAPKQSYLAARPHAEVVEPRQVVNPGEDRRPPIPEWTIRFDPTVNSHVPVPVDPALTPQDAYHEVCGSPINPVAGWDWMLDMKERRIRPVALRPKKPIPEWTRHRDMVSPIPVDAGLRPEEAEHPEYGSPLYPAPGWTWEYNSTTKRFIPRIADEPSHPRHSRFAPAKVRRLYRWHPDDAHYSLLSGKEADDAEVSDDNLYEFVDDPQGCFFKPRPPLRPTIKPDR